MVSVGRDGTKQQISEETCVHVECVRQLALIDTDDHDDSGRGWRRLWLDTCVMYEPGSACRRSRGPTIVLSASRCFASWLSTFRGVGRRAKESDAKSATRLRVAYSLSRLKIFALRVRSLASPDAFEDAVACWVADFGKTLHLKKQTTKIYLFDGTGPEVVAKKVVHQDAVMSMKKP